MIKKNFFKFQSSISNQLKVTRQNPEVLISIEIKTSLNVLPNFFIKGKTVKVLMDGKSFDRWQKFRQF